MEGDFANHSGIKWNGYVGTVEYGGDRSMIAMFYMRPTHNPKMSAEAGRPVYEDKVFVRIHPPGERLNIVDRPATQNEKQRFPQQWAQFQQNISQRPAGTPISLLYPDHPSVGATLEANNVFTIEQCAELTGNAIESIGMGGQRYVNDSQKYLQMANKGVKATELRRELEERDRDIRVQASQIEQLKQEVARLSANQSSFGPAEMQELLSKAMGRPVHMPDKSFDAASAQIAANHPTADITRQRAAASKKRPRVRAAV